MSSKIRGHDRQKHAQRFVQEPSRLPVKRLSRNKSRSTRQIVHKYIKTIPQIIEQSLFLDNIDSNEMYKHIEITEDADYYHELVIEQFLNAFDLKTSFQIDGEYQKDKDLCYLRKGKNFPACRVDHILFTGNSPWKVKNWFIDTFKGQELQNYPSDHRPVTTTFTY